MPLSAKNTAIIRSIDRKFVVKTLAGMRSNLEESTWLGPRNRYTLDTVKKIKTELSSASKSIYRPRQLAQYIAASIVLHCGDGWSYLGRSLNSLMRGDPHRAIHLAYYAELRAAMSLLASFGIGIFDKQHFVISKADSVTPISGDQSTHLFVWDCLELWGGLGSASDLFADIVSPHGIGLVSWLDPVGGASTLAPQAKDWFLQWGMDLQSFTKDRNLRNDSSYRPDGLRQPRQIDAGEALAFIHAFWASMEPSSLCRFESVDAHILRVAVESSFKGRTGHSAADEPEIFKNEVIRIVEAQSLGESAQSRWIDFLCRILAPTDNELLEHSRTAPSVVEKTHLSVFSRAALLLRIASGSAAKILGTAGFKRNNIDFWCQKLGNSRGIWDGDFETDNVLDLWADVRPILSSLEAFQANNEAARQTPHLAYKEVSPHISGLESCERIAIWALT